MFSVTVSDADVDKVCDHREAPRCHRVLPAQVLPVGTQRCQGNRLPPADCARPQQVPLDVLWESRAELRLSLQSERMPLDSRQRWRNPCGTRRLTQIRVVRASRLWSRCATTQEACVWYCGTACAWAGTTAWTLGTSSAWATIASRGASRRSRRT